MTLKGLQNHFLNGLHHLYPKEEVNSFFYLLAEYRLKLSRVKIALHPDVEIQKNDLDFFLNAFAELQQERPIQYIIGETEFYNLLFKITEDVLIPRPETEELVDWVLNEVGSRKPDDRSENPKLKILDIGTGSGCIAVSLAKHLPNAEIYALDVSENALKVAKENAQLNDVKINFIQQDILKTPVILSTPTVIEKEKSILFDIIVSNPPYVRELEKHEIKKNVLNNEPHLALFVKDDNPLLFYDTIAGIAKQQLTKKGMLFFEINQYLGNKTVIFLKTKGFQNIELRKDLFGNDRMIKVN